MHIRVLESAPQSVVIPAGITGLCLSAIFDSRPMHSAAIFASLALFGLDSTRDGCFNDLAHSLLNS